jgi:serine/threonine protein phosphatase 1
MKNTLIIGDIHGCYDELPALLNKAGLSDGDEVIGIGDVVDRGPETPQVVFFFVPHPMPVRSWAIMSANVCALPGMR